MREKFDELHNPARKRKLLQQHERHKHEDEDEQKHKHEEPQQNLNGDKQPSLPSLEDTKLVLKNLIDDNPTIASARSELSNVETIEEGMDVVASFVDRGLASFLNWRDEGKINHTPMGFKSFSTFQDIRKENSLYKFHKGDGEDLTRNIPQLFGNSLPDLQNCRFHCGKMSYIHRDLAFPKAIEHLFATIESDPCCKGIFRSMCDDDNYPSPILIDHLTKNHVLESPTPTTAAALLLHWLRKLPDSLLDGNNFQAIMAACTIDDKLHRNKNLRLLIESSVSSLAGGIVLCRLMKLLRTLLSEENAAKNGLNKIRLSLLFSPILLRGPMHDGGVADLNGTDSMKETVDGQKAIICFLEDWKDLSAGLEEEIKARRDRVAAALEEINNLRKSCDRKLCHVLNLDDDSLNLINRGEEKLGEKDIKDIRNLYENLSAVDDDEISNEEVSTTLRCRFERTRTFNNFEADVPETVSLVVECLSFFLVKFEKQAVAVWNRLREKIPKEVTIAHIGGVIVKILQSVLGLGRGSEGAAAGGSESAMENIGPPPPKSSWNLLSSSDPKAVFCELFAIGLIALENQYVMGRNTVEKVIRKIMSKNPGTIGDCWHFFAAMKEELELHGGIEGADDDDNENGRNVTQSPLQIDKNSTTVTTILSKKQIAVLSGGGDGGGDGGGEESFELAFACYPSSSMTLKDFVSALKTDCRSIFVVRDENDCIFGACFAGNRNNENNGSLLFEIGGGSILTHRPKKNCEINIFTDEEFLAVVVEVETGEKGEHTHSIFLDSELCMGKHKRTDGFIDYSTDSLVFRDEGEVEFFVMNLELWLSTN